MARPLTVKQKRFVDLYNGNATEAARGAGYSGSDAVLGVTGHDLLKNPKVVKALADRPATEAELIVAKKVKTRVDVENFCLEGMEDDDASRTERIKAAELLCKLRGYIIKRIAVGEMTDAELAEEARRRLKG